MKHVKSNLFILLTGVCLIPVLFWNSAQALPETSYWWSQEETRAEKKGYRLINAGQLKDILEREDDILLIDTRPPYEYQDGHVPGAVHFEFDRSDLRDVTGEKKKKFIDLAGPGKHRRIVLYCRSFR